MDFESVRYTYIKSLGVTGWDIFISRIRAPTWKKVMVFCITCITFPIYEGLLIFTLIGPIHSYPSMISIMSFILNCSQITIKSCYFIINRNKMRRLILEFESYNCTKWNLESSWETIQTTSNRVEKMCFYFSCVGYFTAFLWATPSVVRFFNGASTENYKVLPHSYPFATDYFPVSQLVALYEISIVFQAVLQFVAFDRFLMIAVLMLCSQVDVLCSVVERAELKYLHLFVHDHQRLLELLIEVIDFLSPILALQLLHSGVTLCFGTYLITSVNEKNSRFEGALDTIKYFSYVMLLLLELLFYCWLGTKIEICNSNMMFATYSSRWYQSEAIDARGCLIIMTRSSRPVRLTALSMVTLNLETFVDVLHFSYYYYTVLNQLTS